MSSNLVLNKQELKLTSLRSIKNADKEFSIWLNHRKSGVSGIQDFLRRRSQNTDNLIFSIWEASNLSEKKDISLFAVGGYGRQELHPYSDVDLLILYKGELNKKRRNGIESFVSQLWDLELNVGHSVRNQFEEEEIISKVKASNKDNIEKILEEYIEKENLNRQ